MNPYRALLAENRNYRLLWFGQIVSQLGDWFNSVAIYALLLELTGTATSVALMIIVQFLPMAVIGPVAGVVVDRVNRRRLMIATDVLRGLAVLVLLARAPPRPGLARLPGDGRDRVDDGVLRAGAHGGRSRT